RTKTFSCDTRLGKASNQPHECLFATLMGTLLPGAAVTAASSSCVALWMVFLLVTVLVVFTQEMLSVAAANAEIDRAASLYLAYRTRILVLLAGEPPAPVASALQRHADLLDAFARTEEKQGRFLGFRVGYAVVRGFLATVLTVAVGLWSVLRGAGVGFTLETVCPG
ncbi:hypothetical protein DFJ74DRAFT_738138, partial [Hyaloraphidium curvatum]